MKNRIKCLSILFSIGLVRKQVESFKPCRDNHGGEECQNLLAALIAKMVCKK